MSATHICKALVVHCIDYRFVDLQKDFLAKLGYQGEYDLLTVPGAAKNVHRLEEWISLALKLHNPKELFIIDHEDCGAYGEDNSFATHKKHLDQAKEDLMNKYPEIKINTYISEFDKVEEVK